MDEIQMNSTSKPKINFVPCLRWVKRGVAVANPEKVELNEEELERIMSEAKEKLDDGDNNEDVEMDENADTETKYKMSTYDEEEFKPGDMLGIENIATFSDADYRIDHYSDSESEKDDDVIKPDDNLILVGHVEGDASMLEVYVYNEEEGSLYVHHDILLPSFPLCIEWLDLDPSDSKPGNLCAIGSMSPVIEVWDLDIIDCLESAYSLGKVPKKKKSRQNSECYGHTDAVLALSWNRYYEHILASGSVDKTVLLWDLHSGKPSKTLNAFEDKVQALQWHPFEASTLLVGSCDKYTRVFDCRTEDAGSKGWSHEGEVECVRWNPHEPYSYLTGTSEGMLCCVDVRNERPLWEIRAHEKEINGLNVSRQCPGMVVTCSSDENMIVWDLYGGKNVEDVIVDSSKHEPVKVYEKEMRMGGLQCLAACPESPFKIAFGGDNKEKNFSVIDLMKNDCFVSCFSKRKLVEHAVAADANEPSNNGDEEWETEEEREESDD